MAFSSNWPWYSTCFIPLNSNTPLLTWHLQVNTHAVDYLLLVVKNRQFVNLHAVLIEKHICIPHCILSRVGFYFTLH
jgi:hypothetical protein